MLKILLFFCFPLLVFSQNSINPSSFIHLNTENYPYSIKEDLASERSVITEEQSDSTQITIITLVDGSELFGTIIKEDEEKILFRTRVGVEMEISRNQIEEIETVSGVMIEGELRRPDPNRTRLLFAPTGHALPAGSGYFSVYELFFPMIAVGITDFLALSGGVSLFPGADQQIIYLAPKVTFYDGEVTAVSGGILYVTIPDEGNAGIAYGVATFGSPKFSATGGLGFGFVDGDFSSKPMLLLGLEFQISKVSKIITENWIFPGTDESINFISLGIRFFGTNLAADFGLITSTEASGDFPFLPWLGFAYNF
jgi:hypothetical protein